MLVRGNSPISALEPALCGESPVLRVLVLAPRTPGRAEDVVPGGDGRGRPRIKGDEPINLKDVAVGRKKKK